MTDKLNDELAKFQAGFVKRALLAEPDAAADAELEESGRRLAQLVNQARPLRVRLRSGEEHHLIQPVFIFSKTTFEGVIMDQAEFARLRSSQPAALTRIFNQALVESLTPEPQVTTNS